MTTGGVDEAGRGPVIGPLVMAIVCVDEGGEEELREIGVADSKMLTPERRYELEKEIKRIAETWEVVRVEPFEIDEYVKRGGLNELELVKTVELILKTKPSRVFVDSPDPFPERYGQKIAGMTGVEVIAENGADAKYPVVSAASILAKTERDRAVEKIKETYGDFGSGYPHDEATVMFLKEWVKKHGSLPPFVRKSWSTVGKIVDSVFQSTLDKFL